MNTEEIEKGNQAIAEFMEIDFWAAFWNNGATHFNSYWKTKEDVEKLINGSNYLLSNKAVPKMIWLDYHKSWDSLKPVISKVYEFALAYPDKVEKFRNMSIVVDIKPAWEAVVEFAEWHKKHVADFLPSKQ